MMPMVTVLVLVLRYKFQFWGDRLIPLLQMLILSLFKISEADYMFSRQLLAILDDRKDSCDFRQ